jgi:hypothetical protein
MIYNKENKQSKDECHEIALATTQNNENSPLDDSLTYVKTRLPVATTSMHISTPELTDKTKNMSTGQNLNGEKTIPIATATSLHSSAQETPEPITEYASCWFICLWHIIVFPLLQILRLMEKFYC